MSQFRLSILAETVVGRTRGSLAFSGAVGGREIVTYSLLQMTPRRTAFSTRNDSIADKSHQTRP